MLPDLPEGQTHYHRSDCAAHDSCCCHHEHDHKNSRLPKNSHINAGYPDKIQVMNGYSEVGETIPESWESQFDMFVKPKSKHLGSAGWRVAPATVRLWVKGLLAKERDKAQKDTQTARCEHDPRGLCIECYEKTF